MELDFASKFSKLPYILLYVRMQILRILEYGYYESCKSPRNSALHNFPSI